jgi:hypothetical protein
VVVYLGYLLLLILTAVRTAQEGSVLRKTGDRVFVNSDNIGSAATIIEVREGEAQPASHYRVRLDIDGQEFWAFDYEVSDA